MKRTKIIGQATANYLLTFLIILFLICMISSPAKFITKSLEGISAWAFNVLPSVLPFMFFTRVLSSLNTMQSLTRPFSKIMSKAFNTPAISLYTFLMAILSGYPVGTKMIADLYMQGQISKQDAFRMTSFCSTSGPMFIIGAVGIGMFSNVKIGYILFASHIIGAVINGLIFRNIKIKSIQQTSSPSQTASSSQIIDISEITLNSTLAILSVGCIIAIFFIIIECLGPFFNLFPQNVSYFFEGIVEITKGCIDISTLPNKFISTCLCSFVISFGGLSTLLQSITMLSKLKMPIWLFTIQKISHGLLALLAALLLLFVFPL